MNYDFDRVINRSGTNSYKWDQSEKLFGTSDIIPLWVADMDFQAPREVVEDLTEKARFGVYGYTIRMPSYFEAIASWQRTRHGWNVETDWIAPSPGVVTSLSVCVETFTDPGDRIVLQSPVYYPFYDVIKQHGRQVVRNPLRVENGKFAMDYDHLEGEFRKGVRMILLCSPHNPGGRVWSENELRRLGELCVKYDVLIVSDEIHGDLVFAGHRHAPIASLSEAFAERTLTCIAPTKTFNIAGIHASSVIIPNQNLRMAFLHRMKTLSLHMESYFGAAAVESCYSRGAEWLDQLLVYLQGNLDALQHFFEKELPQVKIMKPEGTYLVWADFTAVSRDVQVLKDLMFKQAKVAFSEGSVFGEEGVGFLRINIACPRSLLLEGLRRIAETVRANAQQP